MIKTKTKTGFRERIIKVTPEFELKAFDVLTDNVNKLTNNQLKQSEQISQFAVALNRHIPAYEGMANFTKQVGNELNLFRKEIKSWRKSEVKKIKSNILNGVQKSLNEYGN